jgi:NAD(P)-dependent dehydrogenase (short-subunit alcohol dehydrogenase family)
MKLFNLSGRTALVTGSSRGIGRAIALGLAEQGATVAIHGTKASKALDETLAAAQKFAPHSLAVIGDLASGDAAQKIVTDAIAALGKLDILVANASVQIRKPWAEVTQAEAEHQMQVNFHSTLRMIHAAAPGMQQRKWGRILTIGSVQRSGRTRT